MDVVVTLRTDPRPLKYWGSKFGPAPRVNLSELSSRARPLLMRSPLGARASANTLARCARLAALGRLGPSAIYAHARPARRRESVTLTRHPCALVPSQALSHSLARACDLCWAFERSRLSLRWAEQIQCAVPSRSSAQCRVSRASVLRPMACVYSSPVCSTIHRHACRADVMHSDPSQTAC